VSNCTTAMPEDFTGLFETVDKSQRVSNTAIQNVDKTVLFRVAWPLKDDPAHLPTSPTPLLLTTGGMCAHQDSTTNQFASSRRWFWLRVTSAAWCVCMLLAGCRLLSAAATLSPTAPSAAKLVAKPQQHQPRPLVAAATATLISAPHSSSGSSGVRITGDAVRSAMRQPKPAHHQMRKRCCQLTQRTPCSSGSSKQVVVSHQVDTVPHRWSYHCC